MDILGNVQSIRPNVSGISCTVGDVDLGHPDILAAVFKCREIHLAALSAVEVSAENAYILESLGILQDGVVDVLTVLETLRRHEHSVSAFSYSFAVVCDKVCQLGSGPCSPLIGIVRLILDRNGIERNALAVHILDVVVEVFSVCAVGRFRQFALAC